MCGQMQPEIAVVARSRRDRRRDRCAHCASELITLGGADNGTRHWTIPDQRYDGTLPLHQWHCPPFRYSRPNGRSRMKMSSGVIWVLAGLVTLPLVTEGHVPDARSDSPAAQPISDQARPVVAVVEQFSAALKAGNLNQAGELLADDVLILESGGAEHSRQEYLGQHAAADAAFLKDAQIDVTRRTVRVEGPFAWVGTESELHATRNGKPLTLVSTETTVLKRTAGIWRIVHIHWSSHSKR